MPIVETSKSPKKAKTGPKPSKEIKALVEQVISMVKGKSEIPTRTFCLGPSNYSAVDVEMEGLPKGYTLHEDEESDEEVPMDDDASMDEELMEDFEEEEEEEDVVIDKKPVAKKGKKQSAKSMEVGGKYDFADHF
jgi:hypothetical protein